MIRHVQPTTIFVELCPERAAAMRAGQTKKMGDTLSKVMRALGCASHEARNSGGERESAAPTPRSRTAPRCSVPEALASGAAGLLSGLRLMDMEAGAEFRSALRLADELRARVVLGDRPAAETLRRLAGAVSFADLARMAVPGLGPPPPPELVALQAAGSVEAAVERMKNRRVVKALTEHMRATVPGAMRVMLDERDAIMADALARCEGPRVVGVVGLAHLEGIERRWADAAAAVAAQRALPRGGGGGGG